MGSVKLSVDRTKSEVSDASLQKQITAADTFSYTFVRNLYFHVFKDAGTRSFLEIGFVFHQVDLAAVAYINETF